MSFSSQFVKNCPVCGTKSKCTREESNILFCDCPSCGRYKIVGLADKSDAVVPDDYDKLASYLYYNGKRNRPIDDDFFFNFIGTKMQFEQMYFENPWCYHVTKAIVDNWYPKTFSEKVDIFLLELVSRADYVNETIRFSKEQLESACFVLRHPKESVRSDSDFVKKQVDFLIQYLVEQAYILEAEPYGYKLLSKGYERIDSLQKASPSITKNVFVAMSFAPEMFSIRETIREALIQCGYTPRILDEIEFKHQIESDMLHEIREARFVVAELTGHNNGAYFEAGYALGIGKEVIQICQKDRFQKEGHYYLKPGNLVLWDTKEELTHKLISQIKLLPL